MKWVVKHDIAKRVIDTFLERADNWQRTGELVIPKRSDIASGLEEEEWAMVNEEVALMIASIRKRYKLDVRLPQQTAQIQPEETKADIPAEKAEETLPEPVTGAETAEKPKRTRKKSAGEGKAPARKTRTKKESKAEA